MRGYGILKRAGLSGRRSRPVLGTGFKEFLEMKYHPQLMEHVRARLLERGTRYIRPDGRTFWWSRLLYILAFAYTAGVLAVFLLAEGLQLADGVLSESQTDAVRRWMITVGVSLAFYIAALVLVILRQGLLQFLFTLAPSVALTALFLQIYRASTNGVVLSFYVRHLVPMAVLTVLSGWLCFVLLRAAFLERRAYRAAADALYERYGAGMETMNGADWDAFLQENWQRLYDRPTDKKERRRARAQGAGEADEADAD